MDDAEIERSRREILDGIAPLLREDLSAEHWGRAILEVVRAPGGEAVVAGIDVEEIVGDEEHVESIFGGSSMRALLPALAKVTEALCALEGVELDDVRGGTFVRLDEGFAWLPGLVRAPSRRLDQERDALMARLREKNALLRARLRGDRVELDVDSATLRWWLGERVIGEARATIAGTFARAPRTWAWAWSNPTADELVRRASRDLVDAIQERDLWELTSPTFATDEPTAWALTAFLCDKTRADGVQRIARDEGALFVLVYDARAAR